MRLTPINEDAKKEILSDFAQKYAELIDINAGFEKISLPSLDRPEREFDFLAKYAALMHIIAEHFYKSPNFRLTLPLDFSMTGRIAALDKLFHIDIYASPVRYMVEISGAKYDEGYYKEILGDDYNLLPEFLCNKMRNSDFFGTERPIYRLYRVDFSGDTGKAENTIAELAGHFKRLKSKAFMLPLYAHKIDGLNENALICNTLHGVADLGFGIYIIANDLGGIHHCLNAIMLAR